MFAVGKPSLRPRPSPRWTTPLRAYSRPSIWPAASNWRARIDQGWDTLRSNDAVWMAVEGDDDGERFLLLRIGHGLTDHLLMAEVDAIEHANGEADFAPPRLQVCRVANGLHVYADAFCR